MHCLSPVVIKNPKASGTERTISVPCGHCANCLEKRANDWAFRIAQELKVCQNAYFVTLTYSDKCLPKKKGIPVVSRDDIRKFHYRLKKNFPGIRYFFISEYSPEPEFRPHYHSIYFNLDVPPDALHVKVKQYLCKYWKFGIVDVRNVSAARIKYLANYSVSKNDLPSFYKQKDTRQFTCISKGFGMSFLKDIVKQHYNKNMNPVCSNEGFKLSLPRYYKEKVYDEAKRKILTARAKAFVLQELEQSTPEERAAAQLQGWEYSTNYFARHKKRSRYLTRNIQ